MEIKYLPENTNPQNSDWLLTENDTVTQKLSIENLLALAITLTDLQTALDNKADKSDVNALSTIVEEKANKSAVDNLSSSKINKNLAENTSPSVSDFILLEKTNTGENQQVKIPNLSVISPPEIVTSTLEPNNPRTGLIWNELSSNGFLIQSWIRNNSRWESELKEWRFNQDPSSGVAPIGNFSYTLIPDVRFNLFFNKWTGVFWNQTAISGSGCHFMYLQQGINATYAAYPTSLKERSMSNLPANTTTFFEDDLNVLVSPNSSHTYRLSTGVGASSGGVTSTYKYWQILVYYQLIRK